MKKFLTKNRLAILIVSICLTVILLFSIQDKSIYFLLLLCNILKLLILNAFLLIFVYGVFISVRRIVREVKSKDDRKI